MSKLSDAVERIAATLSVIMRQLDIIVRARQAGMPNDLRWHSITECVPPEGVDVLLHEDCYVHDVTVGTRHGNEYSRLDGKWDVKPRYWMHIPPLE